jgi:hypothetical protein
VYLELGYGSKFIYYEVKPVNPVQDKFDKLVSHFVNNKTVSAIIQLSLALLLRCL